MHVMDWSLIGTGIYMYCMCYQMYHQICVICIVCVIRLHTCIIRFVLYLQNLNISFSFLTYSNNPTPLFTVSEYSHGTSCAGEIIMVTDNGICGTGVAYNAKLGGISHSHYIPLYTFVFSIAVYNIYKVFNFGWLIFVHHNKLKPLTTRMMLYRFTATVTDQWMMGLLWVGPHQNLLLHLNKPHKRYVT